MRVRPYRAGDERALVDLLQRACGRASTEAHWRWKLRARPCTFDNVWLAESEDRVVFHYAGIPSPFKLGSSSCSSSVSVDAMTAPEYRRRGLLTQVVSRAHAEWRERGPAFTLGLPNEQWGSRTQALGWRPLFPLQWLMRPLRPDRMLARRFRRMAFGWAAAPGIAWSRWMQRRSCVDASVEVERIHRSSVDFDEIWNSCNAGWTFSTVRDRAWVDWRFMSPPSRRYFVDVAYRRGAPVGFAAHAVVRRHDRVTAILADLFCARRDQRTRETLLHGLIESLSAGGVESLCTLAVPGSDTFAWLRRRGFFVRQAFSVRLVALRSDLPLEVMRDPTAWHLSAADFDVA